MTALPSDLPRDSVDDWFARRFLFRHVLSAEIDADLRGRILLPVDVADKSFLGDVVEHAIGLSMCDEPPYRHLLNCLNHHRAATLLRLAGYQSDAVADLDAWHRGDTLPEPGRLFVTANRLAQILALLHPRLGRRPNQPRRYRAPTAAASRCPAQRRNRDPVRVASVRRLVEHLRRRFPLGSPFVRDRGR
jgi:hypothetical protein